MSKPTIIMIVHSANDDGIHRLNLSLLDRVGIYGRLTRVDSVAGAWDASTRVHIGSFNHLDEPLFVELVRAAAWHDVRRLQVFIEREDDTSFTEYDVFDKTIPLQIAQQALGRGTGLPAPSEQGIFFQRIRSANAGTQEQVLDTAATTSPWMFEVTAIRPGYYFESRARIVPYDKGTALDTDGASVSPVDLAFDGIGVRWGSRELDVVDSVNKEARGIIRDLNPGDRLQIEGTVRRGPHGIVELYEVRSVSKIP